MDENQELIKKRLFVKIRAALKKCEARELIKEEVKILDIFINLPITRYYSTESLFSGMSFPMIALLGESGQVYFFALRRLLTEKEIEDATRV